jgi:hypothetical protein
MPFSFWIFLFACIVSFIPSALDHGETWKVFKSSSGGEKWKFGLRLFGLWGIPFLLLIATLMSGFEAKNGGEELERAKHDLTNEITNLESMVAGGDSKTKELQLYFSNQWQQSQQQLSTAQQNFAEVERSTQPRRITPEQREKFIRILLAHNNYSKVPIRVIIGKSDSETENFALQFREMLVAAGYGADAKLEPDEAYKRNMIVVTSPDPDIKVPPFNGRGESQEFLRIPDFFVSPTESNQKDADVIAIFSSSNGEISIPDITGSNAPSVMIFYPTTNNPDKSDIHYAYHPTQNSDQILVGIENSLVEAGIKPGFMTGKTILNPGEIGFLIPQKVY